MMMNPFYLMNIVNQANQIKNNPSMLANLLQQRGLVNAQQAEEIKQMGSNYEQVGQYLMNNGRIPNNVQQYQQDVDQVQSYMNQK
jgi:hypothetical protein